VATGARNLIVTLYYNRVGIDGPITEAMAGHYLSHWLGLGWNAIEVDGHNVRELAYAYRLAAAGLRVEPGLPSLGPAERAYLQVRLEEIGRTIPAEAELVARMEQALGGRPLKDYRSFERPEELPAELVFAEGESVATEAWFAWAMRNSASSSWARAI
jgi:hypothetical protein